MEFLRCKEISLSRLMRVQLSQTHNKTQILDSMDCCRLSCVNVDVDGYWIVTTRVLLGANCKERHQLVPWKNCQQI